MTILSLLDWIQNTNLSVAIREGGLPYPVLGGLHLWSIALFGGMLLVTDLRLLGWALKNRSVSDIWYMALPCIKAPRSGSKWCCLLWLECMRWFFAGASTSIPKIWMQV
jgi:hypothetical protein